MYKILSMLSKVCKMPVTFAKNVSKLPCQNLSIFSKSVQNLSKLCDSVKICTFSQKCTSCVQFLNKKIVSQLLCHSVKRVHKIVSQLCDCAINFCKKCTKFCQCCQKCAKCPSHLLKCVNVAVSKFVNFLKKCTKFVKVVWQCQNL